MTRRSDQEKTPDFTPIASDRATKPAGAGTTLMAALLMAAVGAVAAPLGLIIILGEAAPGTVASGIGDLSFESITWGFYVVAGLGALVGFFGTLMVWND